MLSCYPDIGRFDSWFKLLSKQLGRKEVDMLLTFDAVVGELMCILLKLLLRMSMELWDAGLMGEL